MKKIFTIALWLIIATGIVFLLSFAMTDQKNEPCTAVEIKLTDQAQKSFIDKNDINKLITEHFDSLEGQYLDSINTSAVARLLQENPYIRKAEVFKSVSGKIQIEVEREQPLVRIINHNQENYYLAESGAVLPVSSHFTPHVMVATGWIDEGYKNVKDSLFITKNESETVGNTLASVHRLAVSIRSNPYLDRYIEQIYIDKNKEIELVPADGDHIVLLGDAQDLPKKFSNLMTFYRAGKPSVGEGYQTVNLKFTNQVVCKK